VLADLSLRQIRMACEAEREALLARVAARRALNDERTRAALARELAPLPSTAPSERPPLRLTAAQREALSRPQRKRALRTGA
jgi:hypothetical protein